MKQYESQVIRQFKSLSVVMLTFFSFFATDANTADLPKPPLSVPFSVQKMGSKVETELQIVEHRSYFFDLQLMFKETEEDRKRVRKLAGDVMIDKNGKAIEPGVPIVLKFKVSEIDTSGEALILEQKFADLKLVSSSANSFNKRIATVILKPGKYRVSVESLKSIPDLVGTPVVFRIGRNAKTSAIPN